jgi:hypothetical protein
MKAFKIAWFRGSKFIETQRPIIVKPGQASVVIDESMSIITQLNHDPERPGNYKDKTCVLKLFEITPSSQSLVSSISFNLIDFLELDPN